MEITQKIETGNREVFAQKQRAFCRILAEQKLNQPFRKSSVHINEQKKKITYSFKFISWSRGLLFLTAHLRFRKHRNNTEINANK